MDPHSPALSESLLIADLAGEGPTDIVLVGVTGEQYEACSGLSDTARKAVAPAVNVVLTELDRMGATYRALPNSGDLLEWWAPIEDPAALSA
jgi:Ni,Fe-hydrogenase maturation factor